MMAKTTIRQVEGEEAVDIFHWLHHYAFQPTLPYPEKEKTTKRFEQRIGVTYLALFGDNEPVATVASTPLIQNVRGGIFNAGGVFDVITHPNHRRKGYSRELMVEIYSADKEQGRPFTCLYPFRESFYERMGHVSFPQPIEAKFKASALAPLLQKDIPGEVEMMLIGEGFDSYRQYLVEIQKRTHGVAFFEHKDSSGADQNTSWIVLAKVDDEVVGVMIYKMKGDGPVGFDFKPTRFFYHTMEGRYLLLQWIANHIDHAGMVEMLLPPYEHPNTWLSDLEVKTKPFWLPAMGRVLNVSEISGMLIGKGSFTAKINDPMCPWNEGVWTFDSTDGKLQVTEGKNADCELNIQGLSALVYGTNDPASFSIRGWGDPTAKTQAVMREMFPAAMPYLLEYF